MKRLDTAADGSILVLFRFQEMKPFLGIASLVDWRLYGHLSRCIVDGFFSADVDEALLMPLGRRLKQDNLLILGLGSTKRFGRDAFIQSIERLFDVTTRLNSKEIVLALPGRVEGQCDTTSAINWFLDCLEKQENDLNIQIIEPLGAQKAMIPIVERWRLKQLVPQ